MANALGWLMKLFSNESAEQNQDNQEVVEIPGWTVEVKGTVTGFTRNNVDKSGRNPKYNYVLTIESDDIHYENCNFELDDKTTFIAKEKQLLEGLGRPIQRGDFVAIKSIGAGSQPRMLPVHTIALLTL
jgi:hypothetical protein